MNPQSFWKKYKFELNQTMRFRGGYAEVLIKRIPNGWLIKSEVTNQPFDGLDVEVVPAMDEGSNVVHFQTGKSHDLLVLPALPSKSIVFRNNKNLKISAGESTNLYFRIPLNLQFYFQEVKDDNRMLDQPLKRLSDTWFGEIDNGEPAFSIGSNYDKTLADAQPLDWECVSSVEIINNTTSILDLQRLILRVDEYNIYLKNQQLLTSHVTIEFKGQEQAGSVQLGQLKNIHGDKPVLVAKQRSSDTRNLLRKSFYFIKNIYQS